MNTSWPELTSVETFGQLDNGSRLELAVRLAAALGQGYLPHPLLVGDVGLAAVRHVDTDLLLVAVPGGYFSMGLRGDEIEDLGRTLFGEDTERRFKPDFLERYLRTCTPVRTVKVRPFLCATGFVHHDGRAETEEEDAQDEDPSIVPEFAADAIAALRGHGMRLLSEAEWEWVAREGGRRSWIIDVTGKRGMGIDDLKEAPANRWGIRRLKSDLGGFVADGWHSSYEGAPADSRAWDPDPEGLPGVHRGAHTSWQDDSEAITCHAACRWNSQGCDGALRPALDLP